MEKKIWGKDGLSNFFGTERSLESFFPNTTPRRDDEEE
jgi:hypothetical protein